MMNTSINVPFYGDQTRWFVGTVIDASPPYGFEGRIRVRVHGVHSGDTNDVGQSDLPWAQVMIPSTEGGISGLGRIPQIQSGALVFGIFIDGKSSQIPLVLGTLPKEEQPTSVQAAALGTSIIDNLYSYSLSQYNLGNVVPPVGVTNESSLTEKIDRSMFFFIDNGYSIDQAAGIVGSLQAVSGLITSSVDAEGTFNSPRQGIGAWGSQENRLTNLIKFASQFEPSKDWTDFDVQLVFVLHELRTTQTVANARILSSEKIDTGNGSAAMSVRFYLKRSSSFLTNAETFAKAAFQQVNN